jgi:hypothetical protein
MSRVSISGTRVLSSLAEEMAKGVSGGTHVLKNILQNSIRRNARTLLLV